jgi:hypothetical protein
VHRRAYGCVYITPGIQYIINAKGTLLTGNCNACASYGSVGLAAAKTKGGDGSGMAVV